jgi:hypothetical protein
VTGHLHGDTLRREIIGTLILAMASLGMAWSAYQAALWDGEQAAKYVQVSPFRQEASNQSELADLDSRRFHSRFQPDSSLETEANTSMDEGTRNNEIRIRDSYVLNAVFFATAMFLLGIAEHVRWGRVGLMVLGTVMCVAALVMLARSPVL